MASKSTRSRRRKKLRELGVLEETEKCVATNRSGKPCGKYPMEGSFVCSSHGGKSPQSLRKSKERLVLAADHASARLVWLALNSKDERVQLMAIKEVLDRAGLGAKQEIELSLAPWQEAIQVGGIIVDEDDDETDVVVGEVVSETYDEPLPALVDDPPHGISQNARLASSAQRRPARRPRQP